MILCKECEHLIVDKQATIEISSGNHTSFLQYNMFAPIPSLPPPTKIRYVYHLDCFRQLAGDAFVEELDDFVVWEKHSELEAKAKHKDNEEKVLVIVDKVRKKEQELRELEFACKSLIERERSIQVREKALDKYNIQINYAASPEHHYISCSRCGKSKFVPKNKTNFFCSSCIKQTK